jgi:hypothetical protein
MSSRLDCLAAAFALACVTLASVSTGCNSQGHSGEACEADASALYPTYSCNTGLVCNTGEATPTCETPMSQAVTGPCGDSDNCQSGLYCSASHTCAALLSAGEACPDETGCAAGLVCLNQPHPVCVSADGGGAAGAVDAAAVDAAGADAAAADDGGASSDATVDQDGAGGGCGSAGPDGGEVSGACAAGMCCSGGAVGTFYCYTGESGTCPLVP